jgi:hypothetical protein
MRRAIIMSVCTILTLGLVASVIVIAAALSFATALASGLVGAIVGIGAAISAVLLVFVIPVFVAIAWLLSADWPMFVALLWGLLKILGLQ